MRKNINLQDDVVKARLYITARGLFQVQINSKPVGDDVLTPGWTSYQKRIETLTYDVSSDLVKGKNTKQIIRMIRLKKVIIFSGCECFSINR